MVHDVQRPFDEQAVVMSRPPAVRWQLVLLLLPFLWQIGGIPFVNDIALRPFGLPFAMVWQMAGILFASLVIAFVRTLDRRQEARVDSIG